MSTQIDIAVLIQQQIQSAVKTALSEIDLTSIINQSVERYLKLHVENYKFPESSIPVSSINWNGFRVSGDQIHGGIIHKLNSTGIQDDATSCQLTIVDGMIVAEGQFISDTITAKRADIDNVVVTGDLQVSGNINLGEQARDTISRTATAMITDLLDKDLDIKDHSIVNGNDKLLTHDSLGPSVIYSNIRKLGLLQDINVSGSATIGSTMSINNHKVGINTENPVGALTVWDDDAELTIMKSAKKRMFIGSTRGSEIVLGTNADERMRVGLKEVSVTGPIRVMGIRFSIADAVPDNNGEPKEIVMVTNAAPGQPMFYMCQGGNVWAALECRAP